MYNVSLHLRNNSAASTFLAAAVLSHRILSLVCLARAFFACIIFIFVIHVMMLSLLYVFALPTALWFRHMRLQEGLKCLYFNVILFLIPSQPPGKCQFVESSLSSILGRKRILSVLYPCLSVWINLKLLARCPKTSWGNRNYYGLVQTPVSMRIRPTASSFGDSCSALARWKKQRTRLN